jgi:hypothetical protein
VAISEALISIASFEVNFAGTFLDATALSITLKIGHLALTFVILSAPNLNLMLSAVKLSVTMLSIPF